MKKKKKNLLIRFALLLLAGYIAVLFVNLQMQINEKQTEIDRKQAQIHEYQNLNEDLQNKLDNPNAYLDQEARKNGYVKPNSDIFIEDPGAKKATNSTDAG